MAKRVLRFFSAGAHQKNATDLDRLSQRGWQLTKPGSLRYEFAQGDGPQRHMLDYCPLALEETACKHRQEAFEASGWELIGVTHTGWRYFRKPLDVSLPETAYDHPLPRSVAEDRTIGTISVLFWLRVPVLLAGTALAVLAMVRGKQMVLPAVIFLLVILGLTFKMQAMQTRLKP